MSWFSKAEADVRHDEQAVALDLVRATGEAHVKAIVEAAKLQGKVLTAAAVAAATTAAAVVVAKNVAAAQATAQAGVAAATAAAAPTA
jgi:hypothetical protein